MDIQKKIAQLNIMPITDEIYLEHLRPFQLRGADISKQEYYKMYGDTPMFYSDNYLNTHSIEELLLADEKNRKRFRMTFISKLRFKLDAWMFRYL